MFEFSYNVNINNVEFAMQVHNGRQFVRIAITSDKKCQRLFAPQAPLDAIENITVLAEIRRLRGEAFTKLVEDRLDRKLRKSERLTSRAVLPYALMCRGTIASITMPIIEEVQGIAFDVVADSKGPLLIQLTTDVFEYLARVIMKQLTVVIDESPAKKLRSRRGERLVVGLSGASEYEHNGKTYIRCHRKCDHVQKHRYIRYAGDDDYDATLAKAREFLDGTDANQEDDQSGCSDLDEPLQTDDDGDDDVDDTIEPRDLSSMHE
jgi:hypothetical protein